MDVATMMGIFTGSVLIASAIALGGGGGFIHVPALMITLGGTFAATLISFPWEKVRNVAKVIRSTFRARLLRTAEMVNQMVEYAAIVKKEGYVALESKLEDLSDPFLRRAFELILSGTAEQDVRKVLQNELAALQGRHEDGREILQMMGTAAPAFGMIGTLIGLVQMLRDLKSPESIGVGMSVALITTFYGALAANLLFLPLAGKLGARDREEILLRHIIIEGVASIQAGDIPSVTEEKLKAFLTPQTRYAIG